MPPPPAPTLSPCADGGADHVWVLPSAKKMAEALLQRPPAGSSAAVSPESISQYLCDKLTIPSASAFRCVSEWGSVLGCVVLRPRAAITCLVRWRILRAAFVPCPCFSRRACCSQLLVYEQVVVWIVPSTKLLFGHGWSCC